METTSLSETKEYTGKYVPAINDTLYVLNGKWKLLIIGAILQSQKRFNEMRRTMPKITTSQLSKELRDLEANGIVTRRVYSKQPVLVEYELTPSAIRLADVLDKLLEWGLQHSESMIKVKQEVV